MKLVVVFDTSVLFSAIGWSGKPIVITGQMANLCADPKDDMVLECALAAQATQVVSGDKKHLLSLKQFRGISIVSPAELIRMVGAGT
jgi:predicted nucleic acid-binding protein